jgi:hypothetical protein
MIKGKQAFNICEKMHNDVSELYESLIDEEKMATSIVINRIRKNLDLIRAETLLTGN